MLHARLDYNRIQDPAGLIPDNEPVFLLRAQDRLAWIVVAIYALLARFAGRRDIYLITKTWARKMRAWPVKKTPDLP